MVREAGFVGPGYFGVGPRLLETGAKGKAHTYFSSILAVLMVQIRLSF
jgi:hypothetical protein